MNHTTEIDDILVRVDALPAAERVTLAHRILNEARPETVHATPRHTVAEAVGLLRGPGPAPSDAEVKRWMAEHRTSKYGT